MARILITGSADGIGALAAKDLAARGHQVYLHARSSSRAEDAMKNCPKAQQCLVGDLSSSSEVKKLAADINALSPWDCIIHNAGVMHGMAGKTTAEGHGTLFATNTLAPYVLTSLIRGNSKRYVFLGSSLHSGGDGSLGNLRHCGYGDSKLHNIMLALAFARTLKSQGVEESNSIDPGWVPTKMGGAGAPQDIKKSVETYVKLAEGVGSSGGYWGPGAQPDRHYASAAGNVATQDKLMKELQEASGVSPT